MKFIKASVYDIECLNSIRTKNIYINTNQIMTITSGKFRNENCTNIELSDQIIYVKESVEEVLKLLEE